MNHQRAIPCIMKCCSLIAGLSLSSEAADMSRTCGLCLEAKNQCYYFMRLYALKKPKQHDTSPACT